MGVSLAFEVTAATPATREEKASSAACMILSATRHGPHFASIRRLPFALQRDTFKCYKAFYKTLACTRLRHPLLSAHTTPCGGINRQLSARRQFQHPWFQAASTSSSHHRRAVRVLEAARKALSCGLFTADLSRKGRRIAAGSARKSWTT
jgi:hypothetical protein